MANINADTRAMISRAAQRIALKEEKDQRPASLETSFCYGTISKVNTDGTVDVILDGATVATANLRMTTGCIGCAKGDRCIVQTIGHISTITGIMAKTSGGDGPDPEPTPVGVGTLTSYNMNFGTTGSAPTWIRLGTWRGQSNAHSCQIDIWSGDGYNSRPDQNAAMHLFIKKGYQTTPSATKAFGVTVALDNCTTDEVEVRAIATSSTACEVWINFKTWDYWKGHYDYRGMSQWDSSTALQQSYAPSGTVQDLAYLPAGFTVGNGLTFDGGTLSSSYQKILWQTGGTGNWMGDGQTITFSEPISKQPHGAVFAWCLYKNNTSARVDWTYFFVPKQHVSFDISSQGTRGICMSGICEDTNFAKYVYVNDTNATGYAKNRQEVTFGGVYCSNANFVLMAVIGV